MGSARLLDISETDYHADPCDTPSLSSSVAKTIITRSAYHAWREHPKLGGVKREASKAMDVGSLIHSLVLDGGVGLQVIDASDYRTKAAQEARTAAHEAGLVPVLRNALEAAQEAAQRITSRLADRGINLDGRSGAVITWDEPSSLGPVRCRAMLDHLWPASFLELKTISTADVETCQRQAYSLGYDIQMAAYTSAVEALGAPPGRLDPLIAFAEADEPNCVSVFRLNESLAELGRRRWRRAVETWAECLQSGVWPEYQARRQIGYLHAPAWAMHREMEQE
jgi:hypothetical protein